MNVNHERPMTLRYWKRAGGTLLLEFCVVPGRRAIGQDPGVGRRLLDAVIIADGERRKIPSTPAARKGLSLKGHDVVIVQTKARRLGITLLGQALISRDLVVLYCKPKSTRTVALCTIDDEVLRPIAEGYGVEVVVDRQAAPSKIPRKRAKPRRSPARKVARG